VSFVRAICDEKTQYCYSLSVFSVIFRSLTELF